MSKAEPIVNINLLPENHRREKLRAKYSVLILAFLLIIATTPVMFDRVSQSMDTNSKLREKLDALNQQVETRQSTIEKRADMIGLTKEFEIITENKGKATDNIQTIFNAADEIGIDLSSIAYISVSGSILVTCNTDGYSYYEDIRQTLERFRTELESTGKFYSISYPLLDYPVSGTLQFEIETKEPLLENLENEDNLLQATPKKTANNSLK